MKEANEGNVLPRAVKCSVVSATAPDCGQKLIYIYDGDKGEEFATSFDKD
jgi:hypothetical protein